MNFAYTDWLSKNKHIGQCNCGTEHVRFDAATFLLIDDHIRKNEHLFLNTPEKTKFCYVNILGEVPNTSSSSSPGSSPSPSLNPHISQLDQGLKCNECEKSFSKKCHLTRHIKSVHEGISVKCKLCLLDMKPENMKRHMNIKHPSEPLKPLKCELCNQECNSVWNLKRHMKRTHKK